jgi:vancomycin permeability regulator SanA
MLSGTINLKTDLSPHQKISSGLAPGWMAVSRGSAFGLSILIALNLMEIGVHSTSSVKNWFADFSPLTQPVGLTILAMSATAMFMFCMRPALPAPVQWASLGLLLVFVVFCCRELWQLSSRAEQVHAAASMTKPVGILMILLVAGIGVFSGNSERVHGQSSVTAIFVSALLTIQAFAVVTMQSAGVSETPTESAAPMILVFGRPLSTDGHPSDLTTADITASVQALLRDEGHHLMLASTSAETSSDEVEAMKSLAIALGADSSRILTDDKHTQVADLLKGLAMCPELADDRRLVIVAHWYELARLRILARRAGIEVTSVAAMQENVPDGQNIRIARECGALLWAMSAPTVHYLKTAMSGDRSHAESTSF